MIPPLGLGKFWPDLKSWKHLRWVLKSRCQVVLCFGVLNFFKDSFSNFATHQVYL